MKKAISLIPAFLLIAMIFVSCSSTSKIPASERDGLSFESAIKAKSIAYEYEWIRANYPASQPQGQALVEHNRKHYDIITIKTPTGEELDLYFDISSFFGRGF